MTLLIISCIAGILTTLAPCTLPLLPIIIGGSDYGDHVLKIHVKSGVLNAFTFG